MSRPPPKHYVSSMSEDDDGKEVNSKAIPPPPPPALETVLDNSPPIEQNKTNPSGSPPPPPSVLRTHTTDNSNEHQNERKNSAAFSSEDGPASAAAAQAAAQATSLSSSLTNSLPIITRQRSQSITLDTVVTSQFENEAGKSCVCIVLLYELVCLRLCLGDSTTPLELGLPLFDCVMQTTFTNVYVTIISLFNKPRNAHLPETHILAALEAEEVSERIDSLLGEGIEAGMEDYSDDDEESVEVGNRNRTYSTDSFLKKVNLQNDLPQYQYGLYTDGGSASSISNESPEKKVQQQHRRYSSNNRSNVSISVPENSAIEYVSGTTTASSSGADVAKNLAMHIESEHTDSGRDPFLEGVLKNATNTVAAGKEKGKAVAEKMAGAIHRDEDNETQEDEADGPTSGEEINIMQHTSEETDNMNFMAARLRSLQRRRSSFKTSMSRRGSSKLSIDDSDREKTSGDRLIDALNSVDSSKNKRGFLGKLKADYKDLVVPKMPKFEKRISHIMTFLVIPCLSVAALLFYIFDNPLAGNTNTSISWWILFLGVRQPIIFELARVGEVFWVEILALRSTGFNSIVGPYISLAFIQSQGWPYILTFWAILDFVFLYGDYNFPRHWLFWQKKIDLFNASNPVEGVTNAEKYQLLLISCIFFGVMSSLKRLSMAIYLGRRAVAHFGGELETLMAKMILIGEVANLARDIEHKRSLFGGNFSPMEQDQQDEKLVRFREMILEEVVSDSSVEAATPSPRGIQRKRLDVPKPSPSSSDGETPSSNDMQRKTLSAGGRLNHPTPLSDDSKSPGSISQGAAHHRSPSRPRHSPPRPRGSSSDGTFTDGGGTKKKFDTSSTANANLMYLLSEWEEPETATKKSKATVRDLVEFKKAVASMDGRYPLSHAFGHAKTREQCVQSSQEVYDRLMLSVSSDTSALPFSILAVLAMDEKGGYNNAKIKSLIRLFRPDRQGNLIKLDFVKSIDTVYKQLRLLRASIANSAQIDVAFEKIVNAFFYFFLTIIAVAILGFDIWTVFLSFSTFFLGFSFLFGSAASNYFEGLLLIFVRRPYDIGDRIATSNPKSDTNVNGSPTWYVDSVTLFTTTVRFATTNETATYSNGSLAALRIINANRSPKAIIAVLIKFGLETPFTKITVFRTAVENFIKARPREWISLVGFRATRVEADVGYIEYKIVVQHRESWQNIGPVLQSKADLSSFCLEATKKLDMKYESPPMPVNLSTSGPLDMNLCQGDGDNLLRQRDGGGDNVQSISAEDLQEVANLFEIRKKKRR